MRLVIALTVPAMLTACEPSTTSTELLLGAGYPFPDDLTRCRRVAENDYSNQFLDDQADLVACPADAENLGVFVIDTGAEEVDRVGNYILYSVPRA